MAKKFNFRLESVLKLRTEKVLQAQDSLYQVQRVRIEKEKIIDNYHQLKKKLNYEDKKFLKAANLQAISNHKEHLNHEIERLGKEKQQILEIEEFRRQKLTKAMVDERALEKLKERKMNDHSDALKSEESKFFDEVARNLIKE